MKEGQVEEGPRFPLAVSDNSEDQTPQVRFTINNKVKSSTLWKTSILKSHCIMYNYMQDDMFDLNIM